ncbi:MAG: hypothetical protein NT150_10285, partial [Bacteroidetes bacterium]|nr:hypothetical protein [Bacteroidota bacterium]
QAIPGASFSVVPGTPVAGQWYSARILVSTADFPSGSNSTVANSSSDFQLGLLNGDLTGGAARYGYFSDYSSVAGGSANASATPICYNTSTSIVLAGSAGNVQWQQSANGVSGWTNVSGGIGATTTTYSTPLMTTNTYYRAVLTKGTCPAVNSTVATVLVDPLTVVGTVSSNATVCSGANSGTLTLSGNVGSVVRWESSTDNFSTKTNIANVTNTLTYTNILASTKYRALVKSGVCSSGNSSSATITVDAPTVAGAVTSDATVCLGTNSGTLTLAGNTGSIVRWESSTNNFATSTTIANTTASQTYTNISSATKYRAVVKSGTCSAGNSASATISVNPVSVGGTVSGGASVCASGNSGTLTLKGYTGSIIRWESSTDNFATVTTIANTTINQAYSNLSKSTKYRAVVQSGSCATANSTAATIAVASPSAGGVLSGSTVVCPGNNSGVIKLSGYTGTVKGWESTTDATFGGFHTKSIANTTTTLAYSNVHETTKYRALVQSGACAAASPAPAVVTMAIAPSIGVVTGDATVCSGSNSGTITISGSTGSVDHWESSTDNFVTSAVIANTATSYNFTNVNKNTKYRAVLVSGCLTATTGSAAITVNAVSNGGVLSGDASVCSSGNSGQLTLVGNVGNILRWESSEDNFSTTTAIANTSATQVYTNLAKSKQYRVVV